MLMKTQLLFLGTATLLAAASATAAIVVPATNTTFNPGSNTQIGLASNWPDSILPTTGSGVVGLINVDGSIGSENVPNLTLVQSAGTVSTSSNRTVAGTVHWYLTGGDISFGTASLNNAAGNVFNIYALNAASDFTAGVIKLTGGSLLHIESGHFNISGNTQVNDGSIVFGAGSGSFTTPDLRNLTAGSSVINFLPGSLATMTATNITDYSTLWSIGILKYDGANLGTFADHFRVTGSTLSLVPEPSTYALLLGFTALGLILVRRRVRG